MYAPYVVKELTRRRSKTTTVVLTVAVIIVMVITSTTVMNAYSSAIYLPFKGSGSDIILQKADTTGANVESGTHLRPTIRVPFGKTLFNDDEVTDVSALKHVKNVSKSLIVWNYQKTDFISIEGVALPSLRGEKVSSWVDTGRFITENDSKKVVLESHFARFHHLKTGDSIALNGEKFGIVGTIVVGEGSQIASSNVYMTLSDAQNISAIRGYDQLYVKIDDLANEGAVKSEISRMNSTILSISGSSIAASLGNVATIYNEFYLLGVGILLLITILILFKVNAMGLIERRKDIAVMQSVGWTRREITRQITAEILLQTVLGFVVGVVVSAVLLLSLGSISIQGPPVGLETAPTTITVPLTLPPLAVGGSFILVFAVSLLVSYLLARRTAALKPSENLRSV